MNKTFSVLLVGMLFTLLPIIVHAQTPADPGSPDAPLDGGVSILIAAGVGYGVKKWREGKSL